MPKLVVKCPYLKGGTKKNASHLSNMVHYVATRDGVEKVPVPSLGDSEKYLDYIAKRPRVEKLGSHGLFSYYSEENLVLSQVMAEVSQHQGNIWMPIISLKREDAQRYGYESAEAWKPLLNEKIVDIAKSFKIRPDHLKWYAAFHNEGHHPHVHMMIYVIDPKEGYLTGVGLEQLKSTLSTFIVFLA